jgi:MFS family permease
MEGREDGVDGVEVSKSSELSDPTPEPREYNLLRLKEFRFLLGSFAFSTLASRSLVVVLGYQVYKRTGDPLSLGLLGLVEAIPALSLLLIGGYVADRSDRRRIVLVTQIASVLCAILFATLSVNEKQVSMLALYGVVFLIGIARGFSDPAMTAFRAQVIPRPMFVRGSALISSVWLSCAIVGPAMGGIACDQIGIRNTYLVIAVLYAGAFVCIANIAPKPKPEVPKGEPILKSIALGVRYVLHHQVLVGSMALDLFAVLFGGTIALLPIFATDILKVGARGLGFLEAATAVGALLATLWTIKYPPARRAGPMLLTCVAGFGVSIIVFAFSKNFYLSLIALVASGAFDGVSMVIRSSILLTFSPENMRGRVASVNMIFISASNELGAFESGVAAKLLGTIRAVWAGGLLTLLVVAVTAYKAPELRCLNLKDHPVPEEE